MLTEIIGYIARIAMHSNPFLKSNFLMYLVTLTIAPAFLSAAIYLCLARIVVVYGEESSRFRPRTYTIVFCIGDFSALLLQAVGGAIASGASSSSTVSVVPSSRVMILTYSRRNWASTSCWQVSPVRSPLSSSLHSAAPSLPSVFTPFLELRGILTDPALKAQVDQTLLPPSAMGKYISLSPFSNSQISPKQAVLTHIQPTS